MLTPAFALRQRALWEKRLGAGLNGSRFDEAVDVQCRVDGKKILLPAGLDAGPGDRLHIGGAGYLLEDVHPVRDWTGRVSHLEGALA